MRLLLAAAVLCAYTALAQYEYDEDDYNDDIQARDVRESIWKAAHGGSKGSTYHGFDEMAHGYPGHPLKGYGARHHARDVEDEDGLGDSEGFIDSAANFANNVARAVKDKADEAVRHAKAKAGYKDDDDDDEDRHFQWGPQRVGQHYGAGEWPGSKHSTGRGRDGSWKLGKRDTEDDDGVLQDDNNNNDDDGVEYFTDGEFDDDSGSLVERDIADEESADPAATAFEDDDEDIPDPKLEMEEFFDEGLVESDKGGLFERDAEPAPFNFFGWNGKHDDHKGPKHGEHEPWKKGMKQIYARDGGVVPEDDDDLDETYDPAAEDLSISDEEFYERAYDGDFDLDLDKRSAPHIIHDNWGPASGGYAMKDGDRPATKHTGNGAKDKDHTATKHKTGTQTNTKPQAVPTHRGDKEDHTKTKHKDADKTKKAKEPEATANKDRQGGKWFWQ